MSFSNIQKIIRAALFTPTHNGWGLPLLLWGKPGCGKSQVLRGIAASYGLHFDVISPGERGEGAFGVTPVPDGQGYIQYPPPDWTKAFEHRGRGLLLADEINTAGPLIQPAMLGLLLDKRIGGATLPGATRILGASNSVEDSAGGWDLSAPMANRLGHLNWDHPSAAEWADWLFSTSSSDQEARPDVASADAVEATVREKWPAAWAAARGQVAGFITRRPELLHQQPASGSPGVSKAWPSHRTWEMATRALASASCHGLSEVDADMMMIAFVGAGPIGELIKYRSEVDLPDPAQLLTGAVTWKPDFHRLDQIYAVMGSTTALIGSLVDAAGGGPAAMKVDGFPEKFDKFLDVIDDVKVGAKDMAWNATRAIAKMNLTKAAPRVDKLFASMLTAVLAPDQLVRDKPAAAPAKASKPAKGKAAS